MSSYLGNCGSMKLNMPFPEKFRSLVELREDQVTIPDYVWLSYAVCAVKEDSCGWGGWIVESAWKIVGDQRNEVDVNADTEQRCPECGKTLFRTEVEKQFRLNPDAGTKIDYPYETAPIEFAQEPKDFEISTFTIEFPEHLSSEQRQYCLDRLSDTEASLEQQTDCRFRVICSKPKQLGRVGWLLFNTHLSDLCGVISTSGGAVAKTSAYPHPRKL